MNAARSLQAIERNWLAVAQISDCDLGVRGALLEEARRLDGRLAKIAVRADQAVDLISNCAPDASRVIGTDLALAPFVPTAAFEIEQTVVGNPRNA